MGYNSILGLLGLAVAVFLAVADAARADVALVLVEERGCIYCKRWNEEVSPEYAVTAEGRAAPLRRVDIHQPLPTDLALKSPPRITPTFVLVRDGREISRLEGYPGEDFFWGLLQNMLDDAEVDWDADS